MRSYSHRVSFCTTEYSTYSLSSATLRYIRVCQPYSFSSPDLVIRSVMPMLKVKNTCLEPHGHTENSVSCFKTINSFSLLSGETSYNVFLLQWQRWNQMQQEKNDCVICRFFPAWDYNCLCICHISLHSCMYMHMWMHT